MNKEKTILLIDDEADLVEALGFQLKAKTGYNVVIAYDGLDGLEKLKTVTPDLIVLDMNMPRMGGVEFYNRICGSDGMPEYPVLVLTARANLEDLFQDLNVEGFMTKPFELDILLNEIQVIVSKEKAEEAAQNAPAGRNILFVEDDKSVFENIEKVFSEKGFNVEAAYSGGMAFYMMMEKRPDLVFIKFGLPDITGDRIAEKLANMPSLAYIPMVVYSHDTQDINPSIANKLLERIGLNNIIDFSLPEDLVKEAERILSSR